MRKAAVTARPVKQVEFAMTSNPKKVRLDVLLEQLSLAPSRDQAQRLILAGKVLVREEVADKPGIKVDAASPVRVIQPNSPYVSRGGTKLEAALKQFSLDVTGCTAADLGASTGGFTDCLLQHGAKKIFAVDVGHGQLAYALQQDDRVCVLDRTNCRYLQQADLGQAVDLVTADLSFISIKTVFPAIQRILKPSGFALILLKPQFEIGKGRVGKKGIVKKMEDHIQVIRQLAAFFQQQNWRILGIIASPIQGKSGNIEFLAALRPGVKGDPFCLSRVDSLVREAHQHFGIKSGRASPSSKKK